MLIDKLFVYGLLKMGYPNYSLVEPYIITEIDAYTIGSLYKLSKTNQPAYIKDGNYKIYGKLYYLLNTKKLFPVLDYIEQGFERELTSVYAKGEEHIAWIYVYRLDLKDAILIENGVWE
ncbi:gamma-glutamylcyclotransferase [Deferribacter autotrophicus]|uniref:Gamma-glutamylcyclotransferase n=1 Tax=Deferribacter autotrophicus TaxID=500465 RepID=A0A5A8F366_9BACT|nr:gamma-glutamylcyclotransferase family protein [Deferribacter autotrophicus]KAA0258575.1 gamma-glutamylcyclotransferase [Deferribacter autotrophicus]